MRPGHPFQAAAIQHALLSCTLCSLFISQPLDVLVLGKCFDFHKIQIQPSYGANANSFNSLGTV
jgi:hypothetical protein